MTRSEIESKILNLVEKKAISLIEKHLPNDGWTFQWDNAKRRMGQCRYRPKVISMSRILVLEANHLQINNTILHEIAHGMAGHSAGHSWQWKRIALSIGCDGKRCHSVETSVGARYKADCRCDKTHYKFRRPKYGLTGYHCNRCKTKLVFEEIFNVS